MEKIVRRKLYGDVDPYSQLELLPFNDGGWYSGCEIFKEYTDVKYSPKLIVEVGVWMGGSAREMATACLTHYNDFEIVCIDTFLGSEEHWVEGNNVSVRVPLINGRPSLYQQFLSNNAHKGLMPFITPFPIDSQNGFIVFQKLGLIPDQVYIDAGHDYYSVKNDLVNWSSILKSGGVLIGDDWHHEPIRRAAGEVLTGEILSRGSKFVWIKP